MIVMLRYFYTEIHARWPVIHGKSFPHSPAAEKLAETLALCGVEMDLRLDAATGNI
jgi:hypothetical protein